VQDLKIADLADKDNMIRGRGPWEQFVWLLPKHPVFGPIGLVGCTFRRCVFDPSVGLAVDEAYRETFLTDLTR
jgi:hypothetical protein